MCLMLWIVLVWWFVGIVSVLWIMGGNRFSVVVLVVLVVMCRKL